MDMLSEIRHLVHDGGDGWRRALDLAAASGDDVAIDYASEHGWGLVPTSLVRCTGTGTGNGGGNGDGDGNGNGGL